MDFTIASLSTVNRVLRLSITVSTGALPTAVSRCPSNSLFSSAVCMTYSPSETPEQPERQFCCRFISWLKYSMVCESPSLAISCWVLSAVAKSPASPAEALIAPIAVSNCALSYFAKRLQCFAGSSLAR